MKYTTETIIIEHPSEKLLELVSKMREHKLRRRDEMKNVEPLFTLRA